MSQKEQVRLLYVDDVIDVGLSEYLILYAGQCTSRVSYDDYRFKCDVSYVSFFKNSFVQNADIILLDSRLFQERDRGPRYLGEELKIILKRYFPYKEVIIISQNAVDVDYVKKFDKLGTENEVKCYYDKYLKPSLDQKVQTILDNRKIVEKVKENDLWDQYLKEHIADTNSITYPDLTVEKIDELIDEFKKIEAALDVENI